MKKGLRMEKVKRTLDIRRAEESCSCNVCLARNYHPDTAVVVGEYKPDIFDVKCGSVYVHLCRHCLLKLGQAATDVSTGLSSYYEETEGQT